MDKIELNEIIEFIKKKHNVTVDDLKSRSRISKVANARNEAYFLIRKNTDMTFDAIGRFFKRGHSNVYLIYNKLKKESFVSDYIKDTGLITRKQPIIVELLLQEKENIEKKLIEIKRLLNYYQ